MQMNNAAKNNRHAQAHDEAEMKKVISQRPLDESLSEFERARQASKTWSMGQD